MGYAHTGPRSKGVFLSKYLSLFSYNTAGFFAAKQGEALTQSDMSQVARAELH